MYFESLQDVNLNKVNELSKEQEYLILVGQDSANDLKGFVKYVDAIGLKYFGGIYPKIITDNKVVSKGFIVKSLNPVYSELIYPFLMKKVPELSPEKSYTCYLIGDGFSDKNSALIETITAKVKGNVNYVGGGSAIYSNQMGIHKLQQDQVVFNNQGFFKDAMHICIVEERSITKKNLGWDILGGPYVVSEAEGNLIKSIDGENAFDFYKNMLDEIEGISIQKNDALYYASKYTFGIVNDGEVKNVRVPIEVSDEGYIRVVNNVTENMEIYLISGNEQLMKYNHKKILSSNTEPVNSALMVSCLSRDLFLDTRFTEEIETVSDVLNVNIEGMITVGEFTNNNSNNALRIYEGASLVNLIYK